VAVTLQEAHLGDTTTVKETLAEAGETVAQLIDREAGTAPAEAPKVNLDGIEEVVADKLAFAEAKKCDDDLKLLRTRAKNLEQARKRVATP